MAVNMFLWNLPTMEAVGLVSLPASLLTTSVPGWASDMEAQVIQMKKFLQE